MSVTLKGRFFFCAPAMPCAMPGQNVLFLSTFLVPSWRPALFQRNASSYCPNLFWRDALTAVIAVRAPCSFCSPQLCSGATAVLERASVVWVPRFCLSITFLFEHHIFVWAPRFWALHFCFSAAFLFKRRILVWAPHSCLSATFLFERHIII